MSELKKNMILMTKISVKISAEFFYIEISSDKLSALNPSFLRNQLTMMLNDNKIDVNYHKR